MIDETTQVVGMICTLKFMLFISMVLNTCTWANKVIKMLMELKKKNNENEHLEQKNNKKTTTTTWEL